MPISAGTNFAVLAVTLYFFRGSITLAITGVSTDGSATLLYWRLCARQAPALLSEIAGREGI